MYNIFVLNRNIRLIVYILTALYGVSLVVFVIYTIPPGQLQVIRLTQYYALAAISLLYLTLLCSPLTITFPNLPFKGLLMKARKACGISSFFFGLVHATLAFFWQLGGFSGLSFLSVTYLVAITISTIALIILTTLAITSLAYFKVKLGKYWDTIHRFVYLAGILIILHALMLGSHFSNLSTTIPTICASALILLLVLESNRISLYVSRRWQFSRWIILIMLIFSILMVSGYYFLVASQKPSAFNVHSQH